MFHNVTDKKKKLCPKYCTRSRQCAEYYVDRDSTAILLPCKKPGTSCSQSSALIICCNFGLVDTTPHTHTVKVTVAANVTLRTWICHTYIYCSITGATTYSNCTILFGSGIGLFRHRLRLATCLCRRWCWHSKGCCWFRCSPASEFVDVRPTHTFRLLFQPPAR